MRADWLDRSTVDGSSVFPHYESFKKSYLETERLCTDQGFAFKPMILEAHAGGWSALFRKVIHDIARNQAIRSNEKQDGTSLRIAQRIAVTLQRGNTRAVLRRLACPESLEGSSGWDVVMEPEDSLTNFQ